MCRDCFNVCVVILFKKSGHLSCSDFIFFQISFQIKSDYNYSAYEQLILHISNYDYIDPISACDNISQIICCCYSHLVVPRVHSERFGRRAFSVAGPSLWNSLPLVLRTQKDDEHFRRDLKTHLYKQAFM